MNPFLGDGLVTPVLFIIGAVLMVYTLWTIFEQRRSLVFQIERGKWVYALSLLLIAGAIVNYAINGQGLQQIALGCVILAFAIFMAVVRNGVGRQGIYLDGVRYPWAKVSALRLKKEHGVPVLHYTIKEFERVIRLEGSRYKDVERFVAEIKQGYDL